MPAAGPEPREPARGTRLLAALPAAEYERLLPGLEVVRPALKEPLHEAGRPIRHVWFPIKGVVSVIAPAQHGGAVEVATIGNEGLVGLPAFLGAQTSLMATFVQIPGPMAGMRAEALRAEAERGGPLVRLLHRYTHAFLAQLAQSVACNRLHPLRERLARWLLMTGDRAMADEFPVTHEFMAQMLGVRRAGVTEALRELQREPAPLAWTGS